MARLGESREGVRCAELVRAVLDTDPELKVATIRANVWNLHEVYPDEVYKPSRGLFRLTQFRDEDTDSPRAELVSKPHKEIQNDEELVKAIIGQIKDGVPPWRRPWSESTKTVVVGAMRYVATMWPSNIRAPKIPYGIYNGLKLLTIASKREYRTNLWIAENVLDDIDAAVVSDDDRPTELRNYENDGTPIDRPRFVYNIDQIKDCEKTLGLSFQQRSEPVEIRYKHSKKLRDWLVDKRSLLIVHSNSAAFSPSWDRVMLPFRDQFDGEEAYWATLWHEVVHWTGHSSRLNREQHSRWGDHVYAFEELVAELGAAFLCSHLCIPGDLQHHASYLESWCDALEKDLAETEGNRVVVDG